MNKPHDPTRLVLLAPSNERLVFWTIWNFQAIKAWEHISHERSPSLGKSPPTNQGTHHKVDKLSKESNFVKLLFENDERESNPLNIHAVENGEWWGWGWMEKLNLNIVSLFLFIEYTKQYEREFLIQTLKKLLHPLSWFIFPHITFFEYFPFYRVWTKQHYDAFAIFFSTNKDYYNSFSFYDAFSIIAHPLLFYYNSPQNWSTTRQHIPFMCFLLSKF